MPHRTVLTVAPAQGPGWDVEGEGHQALQHFERKDDAVKWAREKARSEQPSQLRVKGTNGRYQAEYTYGSDPRGSKG